MTIDCRDVSARMMELLYGELSGDDRAAIEAHLAGCASCAAELATFQSTRAASRRALDSDEPPGRARQAILRAAAAAVATKQPKPIEARSVPPRPSFWGRWRVRWTLPTFATIGAVAVVVLASKVFLEPDKTVELGRQALRPVPAEAPAAPPRAAEPQATAKAEVQEPATPAAPREREHKDEKRPRLQPPATDEAPARSTKTTVQRRQAVPADGLDGLVGETMKGSGSAGLARHKASASEGLFGDDDISTARPGAAAPKAGKREFAPPPPPRDEPARPAAPATNQMRERDTEGEEGLEETAAPPRGGDGRSSAGAGAAPPAAHAKAKKEAIPMPSGLDDLVRGPAASAAAPAPAPAAGAAKERKADARAEDKAVSKPVAESPVVRADRLFAQGQWAAAARAYRDLLRGDPHNADAARWRQRLAASEQAAAATAAPQR